MAGKQSNNDYPDIMDDDTPTTHNQGVPGSIPVGWNWGCFKNIFSIKT